MSTLSQFFSNSGRFRNNRRLWLASGSATFVVPNGISQILGVVIGGGGGGASTYQPGSYYAHGGAGGGYAQGVIDVTPGQSLAVTIGAGGAATTSYDASGSAGTTSSISTFLSATGGAGGTYTSASSPTAGTGSTSGVSEAFTASGGTAGSIYTYSATGGGSSGTPFGNGMTSSAVNGNQYQASAGGSWGCFPTRTSLGTTLYFSEAGHGTASLGQINISNSNQGANGGSGGTTQGGSGSFFISGSYSVNAQLPSNGGASNWWFPWEVSGGGGGGVPFGGTSTSPSYGGNGGPGGSGAGVTAYYYGQGGNGGFGAGGGGACSQTTSCRGGDGGNGAGGGGAVANAFAQNRSGAGGNGSVIIYW